MKIPSGHSFYGQEVGVLVFRGKSPRIPGDAGHAASFGYPVRYQIVDCGFMDLVEGSGETLEKLRQACKQLREEGIRGVVADCGLVSLSVGAGGGAFVCGLLTLSDPDDLADDRTQRRYRGHHRAFRAAAGEPSPPFRLAGGDGAGNPGHGKPAAFF